MQIVSLAEDSHGIPSVIFCEKKKMPAASVINRKLYSKLPII